MVAGDTTRLEVRLEPGTRCLLGTQASTKIYRNPARLSCHHQTVAEIGDGALLAFTPDAIQAFAGSIFHQHQTFRLGAGAGLVLVDWLSSGRPACGERWAFERFTSRNEVFLADQLIFLDSLRLDGAVSPLSGPFRTGRFDCLALVALLGSPLREAAAAMVAAAAAQPPPTRSALVWSVSPHPHGAILRAAGDSIENVSRLLQQQLHFLGELLVDSPWSRRW
jgi:urease accessory protein